MAENSRVNERNNRPGGARIKNVSVMDDNLRAIERLVEEAAKESTGLISVYRPLDSGEREEIAKTESDEIANAYHVEMADEKKTYYITYKPRVEKGRGKGSKLEHVNRSTPFVQMLLDKIDSTYSFLYCHSKVRTLDIPAPPTASGFTAECGEREHLGGKNKYELFFLIECKDNIDTGERITNIIDSVLLDVDGKSGDFFSHMSYVSLEHTAAGEDEYDAPEIDCAVQGQLNDIITQIRESSEVRQRILDFMTSVPETELHAHMRSRNEAFKSVQSASPREVNALNSSVVCRMMPIGVFLNAIDTDRIPYTVTGKNGASATFYTEINPTVAFAGHVCPHCGRLLTADNGAVAVGTADGYAVGCEECASKCSHKGCTQYVFDDEGCAVCHKLVCAEHARKSVDSYDRLCAECARVFRDSASGRPLSPRDAAVRGREEHYVETEVGRLGKTGAFNRFRSVKLLRKSECVRCKTRTGENETEYRYYLPRETGVCDTCGERFYKDDIREESDAHKKLCVFDRVDCSCGKTVAREHAQLCAEEGCAHGFCADCASAAAEPKRYGGTVRLLRKAKPVKIDGKLICPDHTAVCKVCGQPFLASQTKRCKTCGGVVCHHCARGDKCATCAAADGVTAKNYKQISSRTRAARLNALPLKEKFGATAVFEDYETVVFVTLLPNGKKKVRTHNKLTGGTTEEVV